MRRCAENIQSVLGILFRTREAWRPRGKRWGTRQGQPHCDSLLAPQVLAFLNREGSVKPGAISHAPDGVVPGELSFLPSFHVQKR